MQEFSTKLTWSEVDDKKIDIYENISEDMVRREANVNRSIE